MKSIITSALVSALVTAILVQYAFKPDIEKGLQEKSAALEKRLEQITRKADYAYEASQVLQSRVIGVRDQLSDPKCKPENLRIDLVNGTVGGISLSAPVEYIIKELRSCIDKDDLWEEKTKQAVAEGKLWIVPIKKTTAEFFFMGAPDGRRHIDIPRRRNLQEILIDGKGLTYYQWRDEVLEKVLGKAVLRSKNAVSSEVLKVTADGRSSYTTIYHVRLYEAKYGCVLVRYISLGENGTLQVAQEISMWTGKCSALEDKLDAKVSSNFPLDRM